MMLSMYETWRSRDTNTKILADTILKYSPIFTITINFDNLIFFVAFLRLFWLIMNAKNVNSIK